MLARDEDLLRWSAASRGDSLCRATSCGARSGDGALAAAEGRGRAAAIAPMFIESEEPIRMRRRAASRLVTPPVVSRGGGGTRPASLILTEGDVVVLGPGEDVAVRMGSDGDVEGETATSFSIDGRGTSGPTPTWRGGGVRLWLRPAPPGAVGEFRGEGVLEAIFRQTNTKTHHEKLNLENRKLQWDCLCHDDRYSGRLLACSNTSIMAMLCPKIDDVARRGVATGQGLKHGAVSFKASAVLNPGHWSRWSGACVECGGWLVYQPPLGPPQGGSTKLSGQVKI